jgi:hypothetical protein
MISIYNGRTRGLGQPEQQDIHIQVSVRLRDHLHLFKGARLGVLMAIALHTNEDGWSFPSIPLLRKETGYDASTISKVLTELCKITIDGHRVLLAVQKKEDGKFGNNQYLIFPTPDDVALYEQGNVDARHPRRTKAQESDAPYMGFPYTENPSMGKPYTENPILRRTNREVEPE